MKSTRPHGRTIAEVVEALEPHPFTHELARAIEHLETARALLVAHDEKRRRKQIEFLATQVGPW